MTQEQTTLEMIAATVEEAVAKGLSQLGLSEDDVEIEVLDSGSRGLFGIGSRHARIRLKIKNADPVPVRTIEKPSAPIVKAEPATIREKVQPVIKEEDRALQAARGVVSELLERMHVKATLNTSYTTSAETDEKIILVDIQGDDLSILIGRRSETLNALQYITSLILGKELGEWAPIMIDVQGYRTRRERQLRQLARRMADQAITTGRKQVLEPMPAAERRVIHLELRNHPQVLTESIGEEPNRKVTIVLKK